MNSDRTPQDPSRTDPSGAGRSGEELDAGMPGGDPASGPPLDDPVAHIEAARLNPADPGMSAGPGAERKSLVIPFSIVAALVLGPAIVWIASPHGPRPPVLVFESEDLGCRFEYPSALTAGPNYVKASSGSLLTIERHSLEGAKKDWVAELPDVLFSQVMIQIDENYSDVQEISRSHPTMDGRKALEVVLKGTSNALKRPMMVTISIVANEEWVYVLRSYSAQTLDAEERPLFNRVRETWKFLPSPASGAAP